jgi:penicillin V acylase-like amidase (Ntn superfamily)
MDWNDDTRTNLWVFPRGMQRDGAAGPNSAKWTSKYGSLGTAVYDAAVADGMNEKGLVASLLYLADADYGKADGKPMLSISAWPQYVLDNFATVAEAVETLRTEPFRLGRRPCPLATRARCISRFRTRQATPPSSSISAASSSSITAGNIR